MTDWGHDHVEVPTPDPRPIRAEREKRLGLRWVRVQEPGVSTDRPEVTAADLFRMSEGADFTNGLTVEQHMDWLRHRDRANDYAKEPE